MDPSSQRLIVVLNCGSSSIKFALFDADASPLPYAPRWNGKVQGVGGSSPTYEDSAGERCPVALDREHPYTSALSAIRERIAAWLRGRRVAGVAHRVVHGGASFFEPTVVNASVIAQLRALIPLAPLHQPFPFKAMSLLLEQQPEVLQVACFDTAFHRTLEPVEQVLPLPYAAWQRGLRRYGFHGLSYDYMTYALPERHGALARGRVIVAHLGGGASLCAMRDLRSVTTTMGFSALDGLMMGTRTGALDPGAVLYLMEIEKLSLEEVGRILYHESGLLGVSGISDEPRVIVQHEGDDGERGERARLALALYVRRIVREIGSLMAVLGGLDLLVFTAGVGEHNAFIRERVCAAMAWLGVTIDAEANAEHRTTISRRDSAITVAVEPTNEEWVCARDAQALLQRRTC